MAPSGICEDRTCGRLGWAILQHPPISLCEQLTSQLHLSLYALAGAGDTLNLTLHWLVHMSVKSENPGEVCWGTPQLDDWT